MAVTVYANPTDLYGWLGEIPADAEMQIRQASLLVAKETRFDHYPTDPDTGAPVEQRHIDAFRDATCQQVASWKAAKINPLAGPTGQAPQVASQSVDGGSISYTGLPSTQDITRATEELCQASRLILQLNGLGSRTPGLL